jgi:hypothetical protein
MHTLSLAVALLAATVGAGDLNLVANPGFEAGSRETPWQFQAPVYAVTTDAPRTGTQCLRYTNNDPGRYWMAGQPLVLRPGHRYEVTAWVRTDNIRGNENGATVCVEWSDSSGKFLGGCYPRGVRDTHADWQLVRDLTGPIPPGAVRCKINCYVRQGMTGTAWFDDVTVREVHPPAIEALTTDVYRDQTAGGPVNVLASLADPRAALELEVRDPQGRRVATGPHLDTTPWKPGRYQLTAIARADDGRELGRRSLSLTRVDKYPPRKAYVDSHRRLIVDGEPFFPLGTYWDTITPGDMAIYAKSPFNCLVPYADVGRAGLDLAHANGLRVIYSVKDVYAGHMGLKTEAEARERVTQTVTALKDHPALIAWYISDEAPLAMLDELTTRRQLLEDLDPGRPTWAVLDRPTQVREFLPTFDIIGSDPYPVPKEPPAKAFDWARTTVAQTFGARAVWMVPQVFDWTSYKKPGSRAPTLAEMRCMAWSCIAAGANGLVFYSWFDLQRMDKTVPFEQRWKDVTALAAEIRDRIPLLLSVEPAPVPEVEAPASVAWRVFAKDGAAFVLFVNSDDQKPARVRIRLPEGAARTIELAPLDVQLVPVRPQAPSGR